jgi:hypothetical protein
MKSTTKTRTRLAVYLVGLAAALSAAHASAQIDEDKTGAWYIYAWSKPGTDGKIGFQGDIQHRNWDAGGDLEQLLIRGGATFTPTSGRVQYTLGAAHIVSEPFGPGGDTTREDRLYQEALLPHRIGNKLLVTHRFRFEQRWVDGQDTRLRGRYFIGLNWPLNQDTLGAGARYLSLYNETFVNLNRNIGDGRRVDQFDRNRLYVAFGYSLRDDLRIQLGYMHQQTDDIGKGQLQIGFFHAL